MSQQQVHELYRRYGGLIYSKLRRQLKDERAAEEATVLAFRKMVREGRPIDDQQVVEFLRKIA